MPECRNAGMPECRNAGIPEYRNTGTTRGMKRKVLERNGTKREVLAGNGTIGHAFLPAEFMYNTCA